MSNLTPLARYVAEAAQVNSPQRAIMLSGTLGSGKTTVLGELLSDVRGEPFIVIQNDIGSINTDTRRLKLPPEQLCALTAGCICCNDLRALDLTLDSLSNDDQPLTVFIETTGIANPAQIKDLLHTKQLPTLVIVTVDVAHFERNLRLGRIAETVPVADILVLTHLVNGDGQELDRTAIIESLRALNERADILKLSINGDESIFEKVADAIPPSAQSVLASSPAPMPSLLNRRSGWVGASQDLVELVKSNLHAQFALDFLVPPELDSTRIVQIVSHAVPGGIQRAKGFIRGEGEIDCIHGEWRITPSSGSGQRSYITLIHNAPITSKMFPELVSLNTTEQNGPLEGAQLTDAIALVEELLTYFPSNVVDDGRLITETDAGEAWLYTERAGFPEKLRDEFLFAWTKFFSQQQDALLSGAFDSHPDLPYYQRKVGNTLSWLIVNFPDKVSDWGLGEKISHGHPAELFFRGLAGAKNAIQVGSFKMEDATFFSEQLKLLESEVGPVAYSLADRAIDNCVRRSNDDNWARIARPLVFKWRATETSDSD